MGPMLPSVEYDGEYIVAFGDSPNELAADVKRVVRQGYSLWAAPFAYVDNDNGKTILAQALIR